MDSLFVVQTLTGILTALGVFLLARIFTALTEIRATIQHFAERIATLEERTRTLI